MKRYNFNYLPLSPGEWPSSPPLWAGTLRSRQTWLYSALAAAVVLNLILGWAWWHAVPLTPLDNFRKDEMQIDAPTNPNATAIVSTLYNDMYTLPVLTLGHSLAIHYNTSSPTSQPDRHNPRRLLLYIPHRISPLSLCLARAVGWEPYPVSFIAPPHNGKGIGERFGDQYTKLSLWTLDQIGIEKLVYVDGDTLIRGRFDELFALPFAFGAVPDAWDIAGRGFSVAFNAGVLVLRPATRVFRALLAHMEDARFPPGEAEQAYLNLYFGAEVVKLPYVYNANLVIKVRSPSMWSFMSRSDALRIVHYTKPKPFPFQNPERYRGGRWLDQAREEVAVKVAEAKAYRGGLYREEMGWWEETWQEMERERKEELEKCEREHKGW
ncbi:nucleotide-diphospho-sugar transferase [Dentipellis sp. KUC8613]|nr:nucleotide-diphospho-sugar transferase [Dentipellis sp. KUC8613]